MTETVTPGQRLGALSAYTPGPGTYVLNHHIHASLTGYRTEQTSESNVVLSVRPSAHRTGATDRVLRVGDIVICKVHRVTPRQLYVTIFSRGEIVLYDNLSGILRKEDVRTTDIDKINLAELFQVGDVLQAAVISYGDVRSYFISTAKEGLGKMEHITSIDDSDIMHQ